MTPKFVAVVYKHHDDTYPRSHKPHGDYSCFVADTEEEAVELAKIATQQWEGVHAGPVDPATGYPKPAKYYGPYDIFVGELSGKVSFEYSTEPL